MIQGEPSIDFGRMHGKNSGVYGFLKGKTEYDRYMSRVGEVIS